MRSNKRQPCAQLRLLEARKAVLVDDDAVVHDDAERGGDVDDPARDLDIRLRRSRIAGGFCQQTSTPANPLIYPNICSPAKIGGRGRAVTNENTWWSGGRIFLDVSYSSNRLSTDQISISVLRSCTYRMQQTTIDSRHGGTHWRRVP
jgi:hypothetical protein